ncbi:BTAD domain-containing putative transcriptional regulator, partial [Streptomyces sp. TRM76323]
MDELPELRILGPLDVRVRRRQVQITAPRLQAVLGTLLLHAGEVVPVEHLAETVWEDNLPADPVNQVAVCVSMLRRKLERAGAGRELLVTRPPGYRFAADRVRLDTMTVRRLRAEARERADAGDLTQSLALLRSALVQWRGPVLSGVTRRAWRPEVRRWEEEKIAVREGCSDLQLRLGLYEELIEELSVFVREHPLLERPRHQLMTALSHVGRRADALRLYEETVELLGDEHAAAPGEELRRLHARFLRGTEGPLAPRLITARTGQEHLPGPCQLPGDLADFVGREEEIRTLHRTLVPRPGPVPVAVVAGMAGTGKTALAVHVAHLLRPVFGAGQLYIDLRGTGERPVTPQAALTRFLRELGVQGPAVPDSLDERAELFRSLLADRQVLIVLDDAGHVEQVLPLLPGTGSCAVLVTSRFRLATLPGLHVPELGVFERGEALALLGRLVGERRVAAEPGPAGELVEYCGRLPLAVRVLGAKLASKPHWALRKAASRLADERHRLDELAHEGLQVRSSLAPSYRGLGRAARVLFRRLALLPPSEFSDWLCAPLTDLPPRAAEEALEELLEARLVETTGLDEAGQPRYRMHELVRLYGRELLERAEPRADRTAALSRTARAALALVALAHRALRGADSSAAHGPDRPAGVPEGAEADPLRWYQANRSTVGALCRQAAEHGLGDLAGELAATACGLPGDRFPCD